MFQDMHDILANAKPHTDPLCAITFYAIAHHCIATEQNAMGYAMFWISPYVGGEPPGQTFDDVLANSCGNEIGYVDLALKWYLERHLDKSSPDYNTLKEGIQQARKQILEYMKWSEWEFSSSSDVE
jgi:hypothetical protein